jgi:hypothetical protein
MQDGRDFGVREGLRPAEVSVHSIAQVKCVVQESQ